MKFHVAREGALWGEFEEQAFRNKVFTGEIAPTDFYWRAGYENWRPVSEFRVARKTEVILIESATMRPPELARERNGLRWAGVIAGIVVTALIVAVFVFVGR